MANDDEKSGIDSAKLIAGGFAVISGAVTLIGGYTGAIPRLIRNDSSAFVWAVALSLLAVGFSLLGSQVGNRRARPIPSISSPGESPDSVEKRLANDQDALDAWAEKVNAGKCRLKRGYRSLNTRIVLVAVGFFAFVASAWITITGLQDSLIKIDQPQITTSWKDLEAGVQPIANVKVHIDGVATDDTLIVTVHPGEKLLDVNVKGVVTNYSIYQAKVGANLDGVADMSFDVQVPQGFGSLQIVASLNKVIDCAGNEEVDPSTSTSGQAQGTASPSPETTSVIADPAALPSSTGATDSSSPTDGGDGAESSPATAEVPTGVTLSTTALQPAKPQANNFSCVILLAPVDGVVPPPADPITPMSTSTVLTTVTTVVASQPDGA